MKKTTSLIFVSLFSLGAYADNNSCVLLVSGSMDNIVMQTFEANGYRLTSDESIAGGVLSISQDNEEGEERDGGRYSRYKKSVASATITITPRQVDGYLRASETYLGTASYRLPAGYPQMESARDKAEKRLNAAAEKSLKKALKKLKPCS